jgi:hypothetical protein
MPISVKGETDPLKTYNMLDFKQLIHFSLFFPRVLYGQNIHLRMLRGSI